MTSTQTASIDRPSAYAPPAGFARTLEPVTPGERIAGLDLLRGWAMFGVLWSNLNDWYFTTAPTTSLDQTLSFVQDYLLESRFYTLLCMLFGVGFAIQLSRAQARGVDLRNTYLRRSAALLGFGLIHALLIWHGDVLVSYALASFGLLMFRDATPRQQLAAGIFLTCTGAFLANHLHFALGQLYRMPEEWAGGTPIVYASGTLAQIQRTRFHDVWHWWGWFGLNTFPTTVGSFLLGTWAFRSGLVERVISNRRTTWRFLGVCVAMAIVGYSLEIFHWDVKLWPRPTHLPETLLSWAAWNPRNIVFTPFEQTDLACGLTYAAILLLIFQTPRGRKILTPLTAAGRMGLTTYLTQSIVCTTLFYSYGFRLFGKVGFTGMAVITFTLFGSQLVISTWWLKHFRFGPVEWLWRTLTYGRAPAMRARA